MQLWVSEIIIMLGLAATKHYVNSSKGQLVFEVDFYNVTFIYSSSHMLTSIASDNKGPMSQCNILSDIELLESIGQTTLM